EENTMRSPLGDQTGAVLDDASVVRRCSASRVRSRNQRSNMGPVPRENTTHFSSQSAGAKTRPGTPTVPRGFPPRSYQAICRLVTDLPPLSYTSTPVSDRVTGA